MFVLAYYRIPASLALRTTVYMWRLSHPLRQASRIHDQDALLQQNELSRLTPGNDLAWFAKILVTRASPRRYTFHSYPCRVMPLHGTANTTPPVVSELYSPCSYPNNLLSSVMSDRIRPVFMSFLLTLDIPFTNRQIAHGNYDQHSEYCRNNPVSISQPCDTLRLAEPICE